MTERQERPHHPFAATIARALPELHEFVGRHLGPALLQRETVADLVQSTCGDVLASVDSSIVDESGVRRMLFHRASQKIVDRHRYWTAEKRAGGSMTIDDAVSRIVVPSANPSRDLTRQELIDVAWEEIARMAPDHRRVIELAVREQRPLAQVAVEIGRSYAATRTLLCRALAKLSQAMVDKECDPR